MRKAPRPQSDAKVAASQRASAPPPTPPPKDQTFAAPPAAPGPKRDELMAKLASDGVVGNARTLVAFGRGTFGELSLTDCAKELQDTAKALNGGDLSAAVTMLSSQALALNAIFGELARRSSANMGEYIDASERYMRLALKAQGQCRATLETLAAIKNPPVLFARQANINNGGQQQVNNGAQASGAGSPSPAPASKSSTQPNKLLEASHGERMDLGAQTAAGRTHQVMDPVAVLNRP
jgi:hypothetical protein